jgi:gliding motility-associated-like protein
MLIYIYDRYGKIVSSFDANNLGWDGTYNGYRLPATDYWFVVKRQNGKEYKGHFSMMR